jgi:phosphatidylglycerol lysyltransferase
VLPPLVGLVLFAVALRVLHVELSATSWRDISADIHDTGARPLLLALILTALNYALLTGYDFLGCASLGLRLPAREIARTSFLAYGIANTVGGLALAGYSVRYRFYTRKGVSLGDLSRLALSYSVTFWLGLLLLGGMSLAIDPLPAIRGMPVSWALRLIGSLLAMAPMAYLVAAAFRRTPIRIRSFEVQFPPLRLAIAQLVLSCAEWILFASVLYVLLPSSDLSFLTFLGAFLAAILLGLVSHVPAGLGVFEGMMVLLLHPYLASEQLIPALVVFRAVYYLCPFVLALVLLVADELGQPDSSVARAGVVLGPLTEQLTPRVLSALTFLAGTVLLISGAIPASPSRLRWLERLFPLAVVETSHFLGSVAGALLLILSQGLSRRLDAAYYVAVVTIVAGAAASLLRGVDVVQALLLVGVLLVLRRARPAFYRRAAFFDTRFSPDWIAAIAGAFCASLWLGWFAHRHVAYSNELWWQFAFGAEAPRFLRASVGAALVVLTAGVARLVTPARPETELPSDRDLEDATRIIAAQPSTLPDLVYVRDKALLFNEDRTGFVMYAVAGRTWAALGDPVGPPSAVTGLIRAFLERCDDFAGTPVFYEVGTEHLHRYADFGLTFVRLGERALVDLHAFSLEGPRAARFRQARNRIARAGATFRVLDAEAVSDVMRELRNVSDDWLRTKAGAEKRFSMGGFDEDYLKRFPLAIVEQQGRVVAFANMWLSADREQMCVDLMR